MFENNQSWMILLGIGILVLIFAYLSRSRETFSNELETFYEDSSNRGIDGDKIDELTCSPDCCGNNFPISYGDMTSDELMHNLSLQGEKTPFIRSNYTCGGGGEIRSGCVCLPKKPYMFLVNRGDNALTGDEGCHRGIPEPTLYIKSTPANAAIGDLAGSGGYFARPNESGNQLSYAEVIQARKSMFVDEPRLTDLYYQRPMQSLQNVKQVSPVSGK